MKCRGLALKSGGKNNPPEGVASSGIRIGTRCEIKLTYKLDWSGLRFNRPRAATVCFRLLPRTLSRDNFRAGDKPPTMLGTRKGILIAKQVCPSTKSRQPPVANLYTGMCYASLSQMALKSDRCLPEPAKFIFYPDHLYLNCERCELRRG